MYKMTLQSVTISVDSKEGDRRCTCRGPDDV